jgi:site-specific DNA-methyltransferase (adenine-specific)
MRSLQATFWDADSDSLTISEAAVAMKVSEASIRNWIKTGYLQVIGKKRISRASFEAFRKNVVGSHKLTARANKSGFDHHDHAELTGLVTEMVSNPGYTGDSLSTYYEGALSQSYRNAEGVYYTPPNICDLFFSHLPSDRSKTIFLDPCCGSGNFLLAALRAGFQQDNVFGCDVDETAVAIAKRRIEDATGRRCNTVFHADFLQNFEDLASIPSPDVVFTNPPWGKKLTSAEREQLVKVHSCNKSLDTSGIFLLACKKILAPEGCYGMVMPDAFYNVSSFEVARRALLEDQLVSVFDHGKAFAGLLSGAVSFVAFKKAPNSNFAVKCGSSTRQTVREHASFLRNPSAIINYVATADEATLIEYVYGLPHTTLAGRAKWALGIVTGNNKRHLSPTPRDSFVPVYRGADIERGGLRKPTNFISEDFSGFQQVAPREMYEAPEKLIYRFISSRLVFYHDTNQSMILNSANLVIPHETFPISMKILAKYLNSDFINWLYCKVFATHKVLRSDLERLPILTQYLADLQDFDEEKLLQRIGIERTCSGSYRIKG